LQWKKGHSDTAGSELTDGNVYWEVVEVIVSTDEKRRIVFVSQCNSVCIGE
jgi:hypothetical protein